jgi:hypothetical protein
VPISNKPHNALPIDGLQVALTRAFLRSIGKNVTFSADALPVL